MDPVHVHAHQRGLRLMVRHDMRAALVEGLRPFQRQQIPREMYPFQGVRGLSSFQSWWLCVSATPILTSNKDQEVKELCE